MGPQNHVCILNLVLNLRLMFPVRTTPETSSDSPDKVMQSQFSAFGRGKALFGVPKVPPRPLCKVIPTAQRQHPASQNAALPFRHLRTVSPRDNASKTCYTTKNTNDQGRPQPFGVSVLSPKKKLLLPYSARDRCQLRVKRK